jgi:hypothetical protein
MFSPDPVAFADFVPSQAPADAVFDAEAAEQGRSLRALHAASPSKP